MNKKRGFFPPPSLEKRKKKAGTVKKG